MFVDLLTWLQLMVTKVLWGQTAEFVGFLCLSWRGERDTLKIPGFLRWGIIPELYCCFRILLIFDHFVGVDRFARWSYPWNKSSHASCLNFVWNRIDSSVDVTSWVQLYTWEIRRIFLNYNLCCGPKGNGCEMSTLDCGDRTAVMVVLSTQVVERENKDYSLNTSLLGGLK